MYPISALVLRYTTRSKKEKLNIVKNLGYKNLNKGLRRLDHLIQTGQCPYSLREKLPSVLGIDPSAIQEAFEATLAQQREEEEKARRAEEDFERTTFRPHLWVIHELENPPVGSICGIERWKIITLHENISNLRWSDQCITIKEKIIVHQSDVSVDESIFGRVKGYVYRRNYDESYYFSTDGILLGKYRSKINNPEVYIQIGNKKLRGGILK